MDIRVFVKFTRPHNSDVVVAVVVVVAAVVVVVIKNESNMKLNALTRLVPYYIHVSTI